MGFGTGGLSIKARALRYLSQREHSRVELQRKLARHVPDEPEDTVRQKIDAALDELAARGLLSDARVAEQVLHSQAPRFGSRRLKQTMQAKGLAADLVSKALQQVRCTEYERALALWQRRFGTEADTPAERARQMRFLASRGFEGDVIRRLVCHVARDHDDST
jgi:regulatory protein